MNPAGRVRVQIVVQDSAPSCGRQRAIFTLARSSHFVNTSFFAAMKTPVLSMEATPMSNQLEDVIPSLRGIPKRTLLRGEATYGIPRRLGMTKPTGTVLRAFSSLVVAEGHDVSAQKDVLLTLARPMPALEKWEEPPLNSG